ncbi:MAG: hypothetical protein NTV36_00230 [Candidatus Staskawiczbacteria bacterium]|nr:hypothetical protein [Candidatus Staskawiczbacteria bacterium]
MKSFLRGLVDFLKDWSGIFAMLAIIASPFVMVWGVWYVQTHRTVDVGEGVEVRAIGEMWYAEHVQNSGNHQFYASNELRYSCLDNKMSMNPRFVVVNTTDEDRDVDIHSMSAWRTPVAAKVHLEPGQKFEFQLHTKWQHWYCWINPVPAKKAEKNI